MLDNLRKIVREDRDGIFDKEFFIEGLTFVYNKNGKPKPEEGYKDDRVITQAIKFKLHDLLSAPEGVKLVIATGTDDYGELKKADWRRRIRARRPVEADGV